MHRIIIAPTTTDTRHVVDFIRVAKSVGVRVSVLPRIFEVVGSAVEFEDVDGMTMLGIRRFGLSRSSRVLKRTFDLVLGSFVLLILSPLFLAISLAILVDSRGPIFFGQLRVGREGGHFRILKFRSMVPGADARKDDLRSINEAGDGLFKITNDPRVTRVGRFLRATSLDELPQLLNVVRGEMSLVGPRPLVLDEDAQVVGLDRSRLHLTPGMTGPWQILGTRVPMQEMVAIDYLYVANWSMWLDLQAFTAHGSARGPRGKPVAPVRGRCLTGSVTRLPPPAVCSPGRVGAVLGHLRELETNPTLLLEFVGSAGDLVCRDERDCLVSGWRWRRCRPTRCRSA